jgi:hypothetical protein
MVELRELSEQTQPQVVGHHLGMQVRVAVSLVEVELVVRGWQGMEPSHRAVEMAVLGLLCGGINLQAVVAVVAADLAQKTTQTTPFSVETEDCLISLMPMRVLQATLLPV